MSLRRAYKLANANRPNEISADLSNKLEKIFPFIRERASVEAQKMQPAIWSDTNNCPFILSSFDVLDIAEAKRRLFLGFMSNNPHDDLQHRWGEYNDVGELEKRCPSWENWKPNFGAD